jgi:3'-5' exoribonuclease
VAYKFFKANFKGVPKATILEYLQRVLNSLETPKLIKMCGVVINDPRFQTAPGGASHHHNYAGGLLEHTAEVVQNCQLLMGENPFVDRDVVMASAIYHDCHKIFEYEVDDSGKVLKLDYRQQIGHVVGGFFQFTMDAVDSEGEITPEQGAGIQHCLLAHHGRLEWRSPVEPQTPEAWILHAADMLRARSV